MKLPSTLLLAAAATSSTLAVTTQIISSFPKPTWLENIAAMRNGSILTTILGRAEVYLVTPGRDDNTSTSTSTLAASWPDRQSVLGITEVHPNIFAVAVGNLTTTFSPVNNTFAIWTIDVCSDVPVTQKIADLPSDKVLGVNGLSVFQPPNHPHSPPSTGSILLLADSWAGRLVALDTETKLTTVLLDDATTATNTSAPLSIGINGLKYHKGWIYYTNFARNLVARIAISSTGDAVVGQPDILASSPHVSNPDDMVVARDGRSVYVAEPELTGNGVVRISLEDGQVSVVAEGGDVAGTTALTLGRTDEDRHVLYASTMGGSEAGGTPKYEGKVVRIALE